MSAAGHQTLEEGHTGHYFSQLWTGLGANLAGPETLAAFFRETRWLQTLNRSWDGNFTYDCCSYRKGIFSYRELSDGGSHVLNYCLGRRKLLITGRDADPSIWLKGAEVEETIALATMDFNAMNDTDLLELFDHPLPKVRLAAIETLRARKPVFVERITMMLRDGTNLQRQSVIRYFGEGCPQEQAASAMDMLVSILRDSKEDMAMRAAAVGSLACLGEAAQPFFDDMLRLVIAAKPDDPLGRIDAELGASLNALGKDP